MSPSLDRVRKALVEQVGQHCGLRGYAYAPAKITPPALFIGSLTRTDAAMGGVIDLDGKLYAVVRAGGGALDPALDEYVLGERSMADAIDVDPTLGLAGVSVMYDEAGDYQVIEWAGAEFWGVTLDITIMLG